MKLLNLSFGLLGIALGVVLLATPAWANPPFPNSTYNLFANNRLVGVLKLPANGDQQGAALGAGSYVNADCTNNAGYQFTAHIDLAGIPINNPAGVINAFPPASGPNQRVFKQDQAGKPSNYPGTLSDPRFFMRWFPSTSGAPTQNPPQGQPSGQTASGPSAGDIGTGNVSGRNNPPSAQDQAHFCAIGLNFFAQKVA